MKYNEIKISADETHFIFKNEKLFDKKFKQVLKFHSEGLAPVCDETAWYHIDLQGNAIYKERYDRAFGYYFEKATVIKNNKWFHIDTQGKRIYKISFAWCGNYQENICTVRDFNNKYFHIDNCGNEIYKDKYKYAGDFKDGFAVVKLENGLCKHINKQGKDLNGKLFEDLGVFHKSYATAKDKKAWFHIGKDGNSLYNERYNAIEPFYNGFSLVETFESKKQIIDEKGDLILCL
ncbi:MAG: WG repeat-containing protein [Bacteroidota bacterium]|nr:WG repeat-containing protein [Bacteroidota bacterium]